MCCLEQCLTQAVTQRERHTNAADGLCRQYDADRSGTVDFREFKAYVSQKEAKVWKAFQALDADRSGSITPDEIVKAMTCAPVGALLCI